MFFRSESILQKTNDYCGKEEELYMSTAESGHMRCFLRQGNMLVTEEIKSGI
jgi:hypothetical protein